MLFYNDFCFFLSLIGQKNHIDGRKIDKSYLQLTGALFEVQVSDLSLSSYSSYSIKGRVSVATKAEFLTYNAEELGFLYLDFLTHIIPQLHQGSSTTPIFRNIF